MAKKRYAHVIITEKDKRQPETILKHKHPKGASGLLQFKDKDGKNLKIKFSVPEIPDFEGGKDFLDEKCDTFQICGDLFCAIWKNNPDKGFFFITGNKKSVQFYNRDLKHVPNRVFAVLKHTKKGKTRVLSMRRKLFKNNDN